MALILPVKMSTAKEQADNFFIELYNLYLPTGTLHIAACDEIITFNGIAYQPLPIQRGDIKLTVDSKVDNVELKIANTTQDFTLALYQGLDIRGSQTEIITILYPDSLSDNSIFKYTFTGYLDTPIFDGKEFKITIKARVPNIDVPLRKCQLPCNAWFGDMDECGKAKVTVTHTIGATSTQTVIKDSARTEATNYWKDGIITYHGEGRRVLSSVSGSMTVDYPFTYAVSTGASYTVETGCDKTYKTCDERHSNSINYSGFKNIPFELILRT